MILSKYPVNAPADPSSNQASQLLKLCNTSELMKYIQANGLASVAPTSPPDVKEASQEEDEMDTTVDSIKTEEEECQSLDDGESMNTEVLIAPTPPDMTEMKLEKFSPRNKESFSSLEDDDQKPDSSDRADIDEVPDIDCEYSSESRRNSLRLKYQQMSISRKQRRSSKTNLHKMMQKTKDDIVADATPRSTFQCQRCAKTFSTRSLLSRHWATATKCYICSISVCDLKVLNEHMKSVHSEYS